VLTNEYPIVSSNLAAGYGVYGTADPSQSGSTLVAGTGYGSWMTVKYVLYNGASASSTIVNGPGPVYYTDETFTTVSCVYSESVALDAGIAGWLLPNSGTVTGIGIGTTLWTSAVLKNNNLGSWVFIAVEGFVPKARLAAGAIGASLTGAAGSWTVASQTGILRPCGYIVGTVAANIGDIIATVGLY
jgi:hypothetical protein